SFTNAVAKSKAPAGAKAQAMKTMARLMQPMTPHVAEEVWSLLGGDGLVVNAPWPEADASLLVEDQVTMPIQINGKRRTEVTVAKDTPKDAIEAEVLKLEPVLRALDGGTPKKVIVVPGRIVNVVV
ncbi:MAG: class I tRNA ligase family protein, partial [Pseudomonadota bacterium]